MNLCIELFLGESRAAVIRWGYHWVYSGEHFQRDSSAFLGLRGWIRFIVSLVHTDSVRLASSQNTEARGPQRTWRGRLLSRLTIQRLVQSQGCPFRRNPVEGFFLLELFFLLNLGHCVLCLFCNPTKLSLPLMCPNWNLRTFTFPLTPDQGNFPGFGKLGLSSIGSMVLRLLVRK